MMFMTTPVPTVLPPSLRENRWPSSRGISLFRVRVRSELSPGIIISFPSGSWGGRGRGRGTGKENSAWVKGERKEGRWGEREGEEKGKRQGKKNSRQRETGEKKGGERERGRGEREERKGEVGGEAVHIQ